MLVFVLEICQPLLIDRDRLRQFNSLIGYYIWLYYNYFIAALETRQPLHQKCLFDYNRNPFKLIKFCYAHFLERC